MTIKERVTEKTRNMVEKIDYNTAVGSFARDIVSSVAIELVKGEDDYEDKIDSKNIFNAIGTDLDTEAADAGERRKPATNATGQITITGVNGSLIKKGYKVLNSSNNIEYEILEDRTINNFSTKVQVRCITAGTVGNAEIGTINSFVEVYQGLTKVENEIAITNGKDVESDEELRARIIDLIQKPRISWNTYVFEDTVKEIEEVDKVKCVGRARGKGTIDIIITQKSRDTVEEKLKAEVLKYIDFKIISDIDINVIGAEIKIIDISVTGELSSDFDLESADIKLKELINEYLFNQIFKERISYFDLVEVIQHSGCFEHLENVTLNGVKDDLIADVTKLYRISNISIVTK